VSRFRTKEEQSRILPRLASGGEIGIIIGTHRILSDDVTVKSLGLVIIDEEQRFGVRQKEHFKKLRTQVDVLTLTATPIPRTMYMSLTGVRDISMIQTPPEDRLPVVTHVGVFDEHLARQAILREMERGGQVFFVHNRVRTIENVRERLERIVPEARLVVAHGQMNERQLEPVMARFARGEYDLLLSTSIIESGLDIPTANTLIVDRADWFSPPGSTPARGRSRAQHRRVPYFFHPVGKLTEGRVGWIRGGEHRFGRGLSDRHATWNCGAGASAEGRRASCRSPACAVARAGNHLKARRRAKSRPLPLPEAS
jgi:transcription-repair coupling factor (superfamily II helicase)